MILTSKNPIIGSGFIAKNFQNLNRNIKLQKY